ncbi:MAG: ketopantoate reductase family protein [Candidatus Omnitrophota bacterium]
MNPKNESDSRMKIAVIGAGAIGSIIAAYLTKAGKDVVLIGREEQVQAIKTNGLTIRGIGKDETIQIKALSRLDREYDLVIFATKTQDMEEAYHQNSDYLENCYVLTTQNGVQNDNILSSHFERHKQLSSIVMFGATYTTPGEIVYNFPGDWIIGKPFSPNDPYFNQVINTLTTSQLPLVVSDNITGMKYLKLFVNFNNCIPALLGRSMQETFADLDLCRLSIRLLKEGLDIVSKVNIDLVSLPGFPKERILGLVHMPEDQAAGILQQSLTKLSREPLYGSILQSIMRGKPSEIDFINGEVVALAKGMQHEARLNERMVDMVHSVERTQKYFMIEEIKEKFRLTEKAYKD